VADNKFKALFGKKLSKDSDPQTSLNPDPISDPDEQTWL
jgi:hypothetical protein